MNMIAMTTRMQLHQISDAQYSKLKAVIGLCLALSIILFNTADSQLTRVDAIKASSVLRVVMLDEHETVARHTAPLVSFDYELIADFAQALGVQVKVQRVKRLESLHAVLQAGQADIAVAGRPTFSTGFVSDPYLYTEAMFLHRRNLKQTSLSIEDIAKLKGSLLSQDHAIHGHLFHKLDQLSSTITWKTDKYTEDQQRAQAVASGHVDYAILYSRSFKPLQLLFPQVHAVKLNQEKQPLFWLFPADTGKDSSVLNTANQFLDHIQSTGRLQQLKDRYYSAIAEVDRFDMKWFLRRISQELNAYQAIFKAAGKRYHVDWRLLAAIAYQESHWKPDARSKTGVRGMMMLTRDTAKFLGVQNRLDPKMSIHGGAAYFSKLLRQFSHLESTEKFWFALASYNIGPGHVQDAQFLTERHGNNPDLWHQVKSYLPKLMEEQWHAITRHGYARGTESIQYVHNIRRYYTVLLQMFPHQ